MKHYYFLSGLPRTGSTVLASILNQNPDIHASGTSALLDLLIGLSNIINHNRNLYEISPNQEIELYNGFFKSYYNHINPNIIFDKHRGWPMTIAALKKMNIDPRIVVTIRPIPEIITSYITLIDKNPNIPNFIDESLRNKNLEINNSNRAMLIWTDYLHIPYNIIKNALINHRENLLFIQYDEIVDSPNDTIFKINKFFNIDNYSGYDFNNIINTQHEKDETGWKLKDLHKIRKELKRTSANPIDIIGPDLTNHFKQFSFVV